MDTFEAMETCRAMRYLKPDPIPEDAIRKLIHAATRASNPGNSQGWDFVVLRDAHIKAKLGDAIRGVMSPIIDAMASAEQDPAGRRMYAGVKHLIEGFEAVPVYVFVCGRVVYPYENPIEEMVPAALYPAAQNLIVAARALGLGTTFTTFHTLIEPVVRDVLALPDEVRLGVMIAIGWPAREFGPVKRKPVDEVLHWDRW
ncbi:MAG: nitroreductase family protein [Deltaproteobacteria bacterium]|nr:nitroreductase family protein [Deltaproteobacteria bacterium]MBW2383773.1 nitroreductase family protein [Deltaproteobacteria bacterium]MBW2695350.1 nitroreductase family protein [Deltaproteobacteria bacterium]